MYCPNCGALNDDNALFCSECGTSLADDEEWMPETTEKDTEQTKTVDNQDGEKKKTSRYVFTLGKSFAFTMTEMTVLVVMVALMVVSALAGTIVVFAYGRTDSNQMAQAEQAEQGALLQMEEPDEENAEDAKEDEEDIKEIEEEAAEVVEEAENADYLVPDADTRYYTSSELSGLTKDQLRLARNEIYARHGRRFNDSELQSYFDSKPWYNGTIQPDDFDESVFNKYEKENINLIKSLENQ